MAPKMGYVGSPAFEVGDSRADLPDSSGSGRRGRAAGCHRVQRSGCSRRVAHRRQNVGTAHPPPPRPACSRPGGGKVGPVRRTPPPSAGVAPDALDALSTPQLCLAWRSSYLRLHRVTSSPATAQIVLVRQRMLDELERRDRAGFERWLSTGARAASDPSRYIGHPT